ncbi:MAG: hypothetical protein ACLFVE_10420 [Chitinispirillaceae bacterium]
MVHRLQARYSKTPLSFDLQPLRTQDLKNYLDSLSKKPLSNQERYHLELLSRKLNASGGIYRYHNGEKQVNIKINLDLLGDIRGSANSEALRGKGTLSPLLSGSIGKFSFYSAMDVWTEYRSDTLFTPSDYQPYNGVPYNLYDRGDGNNHLRSSDLPRGGVVYDADWVELETAIDYLKIGPAVHFPLTLSGQTPPITYARAKLDLSILEYQHIVGLLRSQRDKPKYLYAHRLSGSLAEGKFRFGLNEMIVGGSTTDQQGPDDPHNSLREQYYGEERDWEWTYFIPFVPFKFVEHYIGDKDNAAISFDMSLVWPTNFRFYGEFFLDDFLSPWKLFTDDFGNKWALTAGVQYFSELFSRDVSAGIEYSRVEPWVYTHFYGGSHRYDHFDKPLGSRLGPNSQAVIASCDIAVTKRIAAGVKLTSLAKDTARGSRITDVFQDFHKPNADSETKRFLGSGTVHHFRPGIYVAYDPFGIFKLNGLFELDLDQDRGKVHLRLDGGLCF